MKSSDRAILIGLIVVGLFGAFWFLALSPKKDEASELGDQIAQLQSDVSAQEQIVASGHEAQAGYEKNFSSLVVLGKAAPAGGDTPSLITQLVDISDEANASFGLLQLGTAPAEPEPVAAETTTGQTEAEGEAPPTEEESTAVVAAPAPATEASASSLPIGAAVGSAGLGRLVYDMSFQGDFFQIADLFRGIDSLVTSKAASVDVTGRLITINGFTMTKEMTEGPLKVELSMSSYVLPSSQGLTAGGTSTMPPSSVPAATTAPEPAP
ncbi:MAG: hypothetical protein QOI31_2615 [Solirubrobacterales bacterium]|jgi:hypothetical protein|nr:hypothetical protein [Solirubrobacterales bacterium]